MLADPTAAFTKSVDLSLELPPLGELSGCDLMSFRRACVNDVRVDFP